MKNNPFNKNKWEICYNIVNSLILGGAVFFGGAISGGINKETIVAALIASAGAAVIKFQDYWKSEEGEYSKKIINFLP